MHVIHQIISLWNVDSQMRDAYYLLVWNKQKSGFIKLKKLNFAVGISTEISTLRLSYLSIL